MNTSTSISLTLASLLTLVGCANNSIFELELDTPPPEAGRNNVVIEGQLGDADFDADWQQNQISGIVLEDSVAGTTLASFETSGDRLASELRVKVRFCVSERCRDVLDGNAPEVRYIFERVFYQGRYTTNGQVIEMFPDPSLPPPEIDVDKCAVVGEGCWDGSTDFNCLADGRHYCEDS